MTLIDKWESFNLREFYNARYRSGYNPQHPDTNVIQLYKYFIEKSLPEDKSNLNLLDFGCGTGANTHYFANEKFNILGTDISDLAIRIAKNTYPKLNFLLTKDDFNYIDYSTNNDAPIDLIIANKSLYFMPNSDLKALLKQFYEIIKPNGFILATMISSNHYFFNEMSECNIDGLRCIEQNNNRLSFTSFENPVTNQNDLLSKFNIFSPIQTGTYNLTIPEGDTEHYYYIGQKRMDELYYQK